MKKFFSLLLAAIFTLPLAVLGACGDKPDGGGNDGGNGETYADDCEFFPVVYEGIQSVSDPVAYMASAGDISTTAGFIQRNKPDENGVIVSPFFSLEINGESVPVYATRTMGGIHSFTYVDVLSKKADESFTLKIKLTVTEKASVLDKASPEAVVLPESAGVSAEIKERAVRATVSKTGSFSFAFNKNNIEPFTLFVARYEEFSAPEGYEVVDIVPGAHTAAETNFKTQNTVYRFKSGRHKIEAVALPSNSVLHMERGAYWEVMPPSGVPDNVTAMNTPLSAGGSVNVRVTGRGVIDLSACTAAPADRNVYLPALFEGARNVVFDGVVFINSHWWTLIFTNCEDVLVKNCMLFGYRVNSDGIIIANGRNAVVEDCFARTGDDAFETKSLTGSVTCDNVLFRRCAAWTDIAKAFGCIYETSRNTQNVRFKDCSVGFATPTWNSYLGCLVIFMGTVANREVYDVHFEDIEIYSTENSPMNISVGPMESGTAYGYIHDIYFKNVTVKYNKSLVVLRLNTEDSVNGRIGALYFDNIVSNGMRMSAETIKVTNEQLKPADFDWIVIRMTAANFDMDDLKINTLT
jgi:hypothetical protein